MPFVSTSQADTYFYRSELNFLVRRINEHLVRWAMHKFKRLKRHPTPAWAWLGAVIE